MVNFANKNPDMETNQLYSFGWGQNEMKDMMSDTLLHAWNSKSVDEIIKAFDEVGKNGYNGVPANFVFADNKGNIAY